MIKKLLPSFLSLSFLASFFNASAQYSCESNRFIEEVFTEVALTSNVVYGSAVNISGSNQSLQLDVYQPAEDTMSARPLIIFAHGGSFLFGNKTSADIVTMCNKYAKNGYVTSSISYRLGFEGFIPTENTATETVYRATTDMRAAVRFFYKDALTNNNYRIDTNNIFVAGVSAGAFIALHLAYLDQESEIPEAVDPVAFGGIEGNSGNPGYSSNVKAIVNLCGAIGDTSWIEPNDTPCLSMHGTNDDVVPYGTDVINVLGIPLFEVDGSSSIALRQQNLGVDHQFITWTGAPHTPFISSTTYMDSVFMSVTPFLADQLGCETILATNSDLNQDQVLVYPNPANSWISISSPSEIEKVQLFSVSGKLIMSTENTSQIDISTYEKGMYLITILTKDKTIFKRLVIS
ncbi:MAG: T9SS type A sorting domain-containing protein [Bacteroidia bacterium]